MTESTGDSQENELGREPAATTDAPENTSADSASPPDISDIDGATTGQHQIQQVPEPTDSNSPSELSPEQLASMPPPTATPAATADTKIAPVDPPPVDPPPDGTVPTGESTPSPASEPPPASPASEPPAASEPSPAAADAPATSLGTDTVVADIAPRDATASAPSADPNATIKVDPSSAADAATTIAAASPAPTSELVLAGTPGTDPDPDPGKIEPGKTEITPTDTGAADGPAPTGELAIESPAADTAAKDGVTVDQSVDKAADKAVDKRAEKKAKKAEKKAAKAAAKLAAATPPAGSDGFDQPSTKGGRSKRLPVIAAVGLVTVVVLTLGAWLLDTVSTSGQAARGTQLGNVDIGGFDEAEIGTVIDDLNGLLDATSLTVTVDDISVGTTPAALGAELDREQLTQAALDARRDGNILVRPIKWISSFWSTEEVDLLYRVDQDLADTGVETVVNAALEQPVEPALEVVSGELQLAAGSEGVRVDPEELVEELPAVLAGAEPFTLDLQAVPALPELEDDDVQAVADDANDATQDDVIIRVLDSEVEVEPEAVRNWIGLDNQGDELDWVIDEARVLEDLKPLFPALGSEDQKAKFNVIDGEPLIIPASETVICCDTESIANVKDELLKPAPAPEEDDEDEADEDEEPPLRVITLAPEIVGSDEGVAELESLGIIEEVSTFTTNFPCCPPRVTNIHRFADLTRGVIIRPGEDFSLNGHVGMRTIENGFVADGAIAQGVIEPQVGGGISQFATTFFNAAFFAGIEIPEYQAHSLYISRYPEGREATISWRKPDLRVNNQTPYGILVWTEYTDTSITVTFYSTKYFEKVEALPVIRSSNNQCRVVTTPRERTLPDGEVLTDSVFAQYRPGEGFDCAGNSTRPPEGPTLPGPEPVDDTIAPPDPAPGPEPVPGVEPTPPPEPASAPAEVPGGE